ncbi:hypothetical protein V8C86DRAFT_976311 [Haematococcus lacustris]
MLSQAERLKQRQLPGGGGKPGPGNPQQAPQTAAALRGPGHPSRSGQGGEVAVSAAPPLQAWTWQPDLAVGPGPPSALHFNVSHCAGLAGCAVGPGRVALGLDVERVRRTPRSPGGVMALARRRLAPAEVELLSACPDELSRQRLFAWLWAAKEAVLKARGTGLAAHPGLKAFAPGPCRRALCRVATR